MPRHEKPITSVGAIAELAGRLRALRQARGLTYRRLAKLVHVSAPVLSRAAAGRSRPTWLVTRAYVRGCDGNPNEFWPWWQRADAQARTEGTRR